MIKSEVSDLSGQVTKNDNSNAFEAVQRIHDELQSVRVSDQIVGIEMNKFRLVCDAPPVTPRCHLVDEPPDPKNVNEAMKQMTGAKGDLQAELDALRPKAPAGGKKFEQDFAEISKQSQNLNVEIEILSKLTGLSSHYDKGAISKETEKIEKIARDMEKTRRKMEKDLGS